MNEQEESAVCNNKPKKMPDSPVQIICLEAFERSVDQEPESRGMAYRQARYRLFALTTRLPKL